MRKKIIPILFCTIFLGGLGIIVLNNENQKVAMKTENPVKLQMEIDTKTKKEEESKQEEKQEDQKESEAKVIPLIQENEKVEETTTLKKQVDVEELPVVNEDPISKDTPDLEEKPEEGKKPEDTDDSEKEEQPKEQHIWSKWEYKNNQEEERICYHCGIKETQPHNFALKNITFKDGEEERHIVEENYFCKGCHVAHYTITSEVEHRYDNNWQYIQNATEAMYCLDCHHIKTRKHQHQPIPDGIEYVCQESNGDGTHQLQASYICEICKKTIIVSKNEECEYDISYQQTGVNDIHIEVKDCKICHEHQEEEGICNPIGEIQYVKIYSQVYEYYICELCKDECQRAYHVDHKFQQWEYRDSDTHIRYCGCVEAREIANHSYTYDKSMGDTTITCADCGATKEVVAHDHGYGVHDEMDFMEIIKSKAYEERLSAGQVANKNTTPTTWCSRYEFRCKTCGIEYYIYYKHKFKDGFCTRTGYCGGIAEESQESVIQTLALELTDAISESKEEEKELIEDEIQEEKEPIEDEIQEGEKEPIEDEIQEEEKEPIEDEIQEEEKEPIEDEIQEEEKVPIADEIQEDTNDVDELEMEEYPKADNNNLEELT